MNNNKNSHIGITSILFGVLGLISYIIGFFFFSFVDNRIYGMVIGLILGILSIILGYIAKKNGDKYGIYGIYLGSLIIIILIITIILVTPVSVETGYY
jgi:uncharacterized membrane protein